MTQNSNLRFLLALGNKKVVVLKDHDTLNIYSDNRLTSARSRVSVERLAEAVASVQ